ncbi:MAG: UDP-2,3-diacylglucosamine diphosphatase LpxI, partial [Deltaproteobacteria bacterium]|nr:UDP-2,3-diacylglucosamine diphosphatase LpxI [Deltaproteobacteria bacterium]
MALELQSPLGLIAGNGSFPIEFARQAKKKGFEVIAVAHSGETDPELEKLVSRCVWVKVGELGKVLDTLSSGGVRQAAFAGGISRVKLFGGVKLDLRGIALISRIGSVKDDALLRGVASEIEKLGITVIPAGVLLDQVTLGAGCLTRRSLTAAEAADARIGWQACRAIGAIDVGQTIIVSQGL